MVGECPEGARNDGADDGEGAEARGAFPRLLVVEVESGECCSRAAAGVRREGERRALGLGLGFGFGFGFGFGLGLG